MTIKQETQRYDPFARAVPGQSFTDEPGLRPYERPPLETDPEKLYKVLDEQLSEESTSDKIADMLEIGVSVETVSEILVQKCFTEGVCSPDVAEIIKPFIFMTVAEIGSEHSVRDMELFNENEEDERMDSEQKLLMMKNLNSEKFNDMLSRSESVASQEEEFAQLQEEQLESDIDEEYMEMYSDEDEMQEDLLPTSQLSFMERDTERLEIPDLENTEEDMQEEEVA